MKNVAVSVRIAIAILMLTLLGAPASAQNVPDARVQEILIKASLLTFNDANVTGNYEVMHAKLAKAFGDQFPPQRLAETFKGFRDLHVNLDMIAAMKPVPVDAKVDGSGKLMLKGYFDTSPSRTNYDLGYVMQDGEWKLVGINVDLKKPD
jgi:hypothetical protein